MRKGLIRKAGFGVVATLMSTVAHAGSAHGRIQFVEGHINPACRVIALKRSSDGAIVLYRIPDTGADNSILAVAMTAFSLRQNVTIVFSDNGTTGCGSEPRIEFLRMAADD